MKEHECTKGGLSNVMSNQRGSWMQCAKPLGRASVGESVTGIPRGVRERDRALGDNCTNNAPPDPSKPWIDRTHKKPMHASSARGPPLDLC